MKTKTFLWFLLGLSLVLMYLTPLASDWIIRNPAKTAGLLCSYILIVSIILWKIYKKP